MERREDGPEAEPIAGSGNERWSARRWSDAVLVAALRRNQPGAFREFFERFAPLITAMARLHRIPASGIDERVTEFLDDAAMRLCMPATPVPRSLAAYLAAAFRRRSFNRKRDLQRRALLRDACATDTGVLTERVVPGAVSENALRTSYGPDLDPPILSPVLERLALELERGLSSDERRVLAWLGQRVPQRQIAEWLGITHGAVRVRIARLRARLRDAASRHIERLDGDERAELARFFRRIDAVGPASLAPPRASPDIRGNRTHAGEDSTQ